VLEHPQQIEAGVLDVGNIDVGNRQSQPVVLLQGWPYDIHSYAEVAPALANAGYRVVSNPVRDAEDVPSTPRRRPWR